MTPVDSQRPAVASGSGAVPPRSMLPKPVRFVLTVVIAAVVGPLIGGAFFLLSAAMHIAELDAEGIRGLFILMVLGAYVIGGVIALVAGTLVAVAALWRQPTFVVIIAATVVANIGYLAATEPETFIPSALTTASLVTLAFSLFSATGCWLLFRRLLRNP